MSHSLTIPSSKLAALAPKKALKKAAGPQHEKKHAGPGHGPKKKHDPEAEHRRAYLHLARASALLAVLPRSSALSDLRRLHSICEAMVKAATASPKTVAESSRALEHLCFASLASSGSFSGSLPRLDKKQRHNWSRHLEDDFAKQEEHAGEAKIAFSNSPGDGQPLRADLFHLAQQSLATADRMLQEENWHVAQECLRATDALTKALDHLS